MTTEPVNSALTAVTGNGWIAGGLGAGQGMAALATAIRPVDGLAAAGLGWLTGQVGPLQDVVDRMAGNVSVVETFNDSWQRVASNLDGIQESLGRAASVDTAEWQGSAADGYRGRAGEVGSALGGTAVLATGLAWAARTMGEVVAGARQSAGDLLTDLVRRLISYATQAIAAEGGVTTNVMSQTTKMINSYAEPIAELERNVHQTIANVEPLLTTLAGVGDPPIPDLVPDSKPADDQPDDAHLPRLQLLTDEEALARLPAYYSTDDHSRRFQNLPPSEQNSLNGIVTHFSKRPSGEIKPAFTDFNTTDALSRGPSDSYPTASRWLTEPTITFKHSGTDTPVLYREIIVMDRSLSTLGLHQAIDNLARFGPDVPRDVWVQVPEGTRTDQIENLLRDFGRPLDPGVNVIFRDPEGRLLGVGTRGDLR